ncbi:23S rRNA (guanosine(2251)-2'-O)-methyltransferase RlmB [Candidatus Palibaumannia cicadellinicola]|uniref:23S rRNA (guanosine-2'-O-)-methyltransferase RlmB n=1 Tax=Candidatus Palibaumannia cicadellinicola TaxID=186490 RepID=A0A088MYW1_9GAMM|nr:23S rRNA (guanosine(2251)-2'-O)-methyltransferase RlmB [Candidatus Baumannia cicadellinicola]AIN47497.1 23S rRNA (guanosine-2'-O-) -methyltransferase rlmB [Candidatus Baumannia cicadellinicola]
MSEIIYGIHAVQALLKRAPQLFREVYILKKRDDQRFKSLIKQLEQADIIIQLVNRQWLDRQAEGTVHQGIMALVQQQRSQFQEQDLPTLLAPHDGAPLLLVLDGVTDPHNLGACLRCADAAGVHAVIIPNNRSVHLNATAKKVASGAAETIPLIRVTNLVRTLQLLQQYHVCIIGTAIEADHNLYHNQLNFTGPIALVMGAEGKGMRRLTKEHCDELIRIPMVGSVSSLNVSVAVGICLFEVVRQRIG